MALIGLVRVSTDEQLTDRQHVEMQKVGCERVFEEKVSGKYGVDKRPGLSAALDYIRPGDVLVVLDVKRLGRSLVNGLEVLGELFERGITVKVLEGLGAGEHTERTLVIDIALAIAEDHRREIVRSTKQGLEAAKARGIQLGRKNVMTEAMTVQAAALKASGYSLRQIQPHLWYRLADGTRRNPSIGAISQALSAHDAGAGAAVAQ